MKSTEDKANLIAATVAEIAIVVAVTGIEPYAPTIRQYHLHKTGGTPTAKVALSCAGLPVTIAGWASFVHEYMGLEIEPRDVMRSRRAARAGMSRSGTAGKNTGEDVEFIHERDFTQWGLLVCGMEETEHEIVYMLR